MDVTSQNSQGILLMPTNTRIRSEFPTCFLISVLIFQYTRTSDATWHKQTQKNLILPDVATPI